MRSNIRTNCGNCLYRATLALTLFFDVSTYARQQATTAPQTAAGRQVVVTVDDLPGAVPGTDKSPGKLKDLKSENLAIVRVLRKHNVPAIGFVIEKKLQVSGERDARAAILEQWIDAGLELGNHTYSHVNFADTPLEEFEDDTIRGDMVTRGLLSGKGETERYFRHPALSTGPTPEAKAAFEGFLKSRGYQLAPVTVENADYEFNDVLDDARMHKDKQLAAKTKDEYLKHTQGMFLYVENASKKLFNREIPQVLLIHDNEINSELLDSLLTDLERKGYRFVSLADALSDPAYGSRDNFIGNLNSCYLCWMNRLVAAGQKPDESDAPPKPPVWITQKFEEIRKAHSE